MSVGRGVWVSSQMLREISWLTFQIFFFLFFFYLCFIFGGVMYLGNLWFNGSKYLRFYHWKFSAWLEYNSNFFMRWFSATIFRTLCFGGINKWLQCGSVEEVWGSSPNNYDTVQCKPLKVHNIQLGSWIYCWLIHWIVWY